MATQMLNKTELREVYEAAHFAIEHAESIEGELILKVSFDTAFDCWFLDCGQCSLMLSSQKVALAFLEELPNL